VKRGPVATQGGRSGYGQRLAAAGGLSIRGEGKAQKGVGDIEHALKDKRSR
jgi:hypothetical protein